MAETALLSQAPLGAARVKIDVLQVISKKGVHRFVDEPPHDEGGTSGRHWRYCGYRSDVGAQRTDNGLFSGTLILAASGKELDAGHTVLFSNDGSKYLAVEQESGVDGEHWTISDKSGNILWKGFAGTTSQIEGASVVVASFEQPRWDSKNQLTVRMICSASGVKGSVHLTKQRSGGWAWKSDRRCQ